MPTTGKDAMFPDGVGYSYGQGATVTQLTSRTTGVTANALSGQITLVAAAPSTTPTSFTVTDTKVGADDVVIASVRSSNAGNVYAVSVSAVADGSFRLSVWSQSGIVSDSPVISFAVFKLDIT